MLQHAMATVGADRILFSIDYPFILPLDGGWTSLSGGGPDQLPRQTEDRLSQRGASAGARLPPGRSSLIHRCY